MDIKNFTGHDINIVSQTEDGERTVTHTFPSEGCARVSFETQKKYCITSQGVIPISYKKVGETTGLPERETKVIKVCDDCGCPQFTDECYDCSSKFSYDADVLASRIIVSKIVAEANSHRDDLLIVDETVRVDGRIIGCKGLACL